MPSINHELSLDNLEQVSGGNPALVAFGLGVLAGVIGNAVYDGLKSGAITAPACGLMGSAGKYAGCPT
ncbi:hypothetical protein [Bradyrhizobium sp. USDA 4452]